jgi:4-amino-4-deoxy-L-arabinose transferase-like glycosyltransferase
LSFRFACIVVGLASALAAARVVSTYADVSETFDEPAHISSGMEWLDRGRYTYDPLHPPLARALIAIGPWLVGARSQGTVGRPWQEGHAVLNSTGKPRTALALARAGVLPFLVLATVMVFLWGRRTLGEAAGAAAAILFTTVPPVLAHAGLATTDMAAAATITTGLVAVVVWLERPSAARTIALGVAVGLALLAKLSALVYLSAASAAIAAPWLATRDDGMRWRDRALRLGAAGVIALLLLWAGYRFSVGPLLDRPMIPDQNRSRLVEAVRAAARLPVYPAPEYASGIRMLRSKNADGFKNVLLGERIRQGRWYFFPVALAVKTPVPFLLLAVFGTVALARSAAAGRRWAEAAPVAASVAILIAALPSNITIGVRHVLPIYGPLAVLAGAGARALWLRRSMFPFGAVIVVALIGWQLVESARADGQFLSYFNQLAGAHPERVLIDSDLDWGQDLDHLADTLRARGIKKVAVSIYTKADLEQHGLPEFTELEPNTPVTGWVAISAFRLYLGYLGDSPFDDFAWLRRYSPVATIGNSIYLYHIE